MVASVRGALLIALTAGCVGGFRAIECSFEEGATERTIRVDAMLLDGVLIPLAAVAGVTALLVDRVLRH